jgi:hypothetical protein
MDERGPQTAHLMKPEEVCYCVNGWICEQHREQGWSHDGCGSPGMPCPRCRPHTTGSATLDEQPKLPRDWRSIASTLRWSE